MTTPPMTPPIPTPAASVVTGPLTSKAAIEKLSPMMQQWTDCKAQCPNALLLFRMGDFYEAFHEDATRLSRELSLTLTQRQGIAMAGIPVSSLDSALEKLSIRGHRVGVAEQMEDPKKTKGIVDRQVVRVVTPGTYTASHDEGRSHTWVVSLSHQGELALAGCDISTCEMVTSSFENWAELETELYRLRPREIIVSPKTVLALPQLRILCEQMGGFISEVDEQLFEATKAREKVQSHFAIHSADSFGLRDLPGCVRCVGALINYLQDQLRLPLEALRSIQLLPKEGILQLDRNTQKNLEVTQPLFEGHWHNTLFHHLDQTQTPMGSRLLRQWLVRPLNCTRQIAARSEAIEQALENPLTIRKIRKELASVRDLKRLSTKIATQSASARDLASLRSSLGALPLMCQQLDLLHRGLWSDLRSRITPQPATVDLLQRALCDEPALRVGEGAIIRDGFHKELDDLRSIREQGQQWLSKYQLQLKESFGIKNLKVGYTPAFGYFIEVSKSQASLMPPQFTRRQTLVGSERFISPELKSFEDKTLHAQERIEAQERELLLALLQQLQPLSPMLDGCADALAGCDVLLSLAEVAQLYQYKKPLVDGSDHLEIIQGRHPIVERMVGREQFIANDTHMSLAAGSMVILTGPNMAGKSTYIRQVALLVLMAQIGSFVPAQSMHIGLIDRIFTRVGASDDLARGQSTFMVEMSETANILHNATNRSLVILDEVGRGTSTYDGIAIARAIAEFLLTHPGRQPKTLFATHYSELTDLPKFFSQVRNYKVAVKEWQGDVVFLHQIIPGFADRSYGIHVARLAGLPLSVIQRAQAIQQQLEKTKVSDRGSKASSQLDLFATPPAVMPAAPDPRLNKMAGYLDALDVNQITPLQAIALLQEISSSWKSTPT